jgi:hypothetical protein
MSRGLHLNLALLAFAASAQAQSRPCEVDVPVNIVTPEAALVRSLRQDAFVAHHGNDAIAIRSVGADTTPRRIVLVVENGKSVNPAARKVEASVLRFVMTNARAADSFAFLTALGPREEVHFGAPREELLSAIGELSSPAKGKGQTKSTLDTVVETAGWLQPRQPGDSIVLFTMGLAPGDAGYGRAGKVLTAAGVRLFGFQLGRLYAGIYSTGVTSGAGGMLLPTATIDPNRQTIFDLAEQTGGVFWGENTEGDPQKTYQLTDERLQLLGKFGEQLYKGIVEYYRIRVDAAPEGFTIDLTDSVRQKLRQPHMVYPRRLPDCLAASPANPSLPSPTMK